MSKSALIAALGIALLAIAAKAETGGASPLLAPSTPWKVDYAEEECRLLRTFGTGDDAVTMRLARGSGVQSFDMVIAGNEIPRLGGDVKVTLKLEPQGIEESFEGYAMGVPDRPERFIRWYDGNPAVLDSVTNNQRARLLADERLDVTMLWTDGKAAIAALQTCHDDLLKSWGVDVAALRAVKIQPKPLGSPGRWATNDDYPTRALNREIEGTVTFQLKLDREGVVENCLILLSSDDAQLDEQSCKLMMARAKFEPARDANDQPTASYYVNRIRWQIPQ